MSCVNEREPGDANVVSRSSACSMLKHSFRYHFTFGEHIGKFTWPGMSFSVDVESTDADHLKFKTGSLCIDEECPQWGTIHLLSGILYQHIYAAERDLLQASMKAPMYGVIQCIRVAFAEASTM